MPALEVESLFPTLVARNASSTANNASGDVLQVICAFPVSGQYGPGTRILYYVLVTACVVARKNVLLKNVCLAAALLFPAVAAIHGIVLAAIHMPTVVDMDIYGAFQLCTIGLLAAPVTAKISTTYFFDPSRNVIFVWTGLVLAGLLSLTVEFFRSTGVPCPDDENGNPISPDRNKFPYGITACNLVCNTTSGPFSPLRGGSGNNINVVPIPFRITFGAATLISAACCIPAILSLVSMWNKILEYNWKRRFARNDPDNPDDPDHNQLISGTNGATTAGMNMINGYIRRFLSVVEVPIFGGAVLSVLIVGEINFWSDPVNFDTEPMANVGQWAPIVTTFFAVLGALYLALATDAEDVRDGKSLHDSTREDHRGSRMIRENSSGHLGHSPTGNFTPSLDGTEAHVRHDTIASTTSGGRMESLALADTIQSASNLNETASLEHSQTQATTIHRIETGSRIRAAKFLNSLADRIGTPAPDRFDNSWFRYGKAADFPRIPGEEYRSKDLRQKEERYNVKRDDEGSPDQRGISRSGSFTGSARSRSSIDTPRPPRSSTLQSPESSNFLSPAQTTARRQRISTLPSQPSSSEMARLAAVPGPSGLFTRRRDTTGQLSAPIRSHLRFNSADAGIPVITVAAEPESRQSPAIVVSSDHDNGPKRDPSRESPRSGAPPASA